MLLLWRRTVTGAAALLAAQGLAVAALALTVAPESGPGLLAVAALVGGVKGVLIPWLLRRTAQAVDAGSEVTPLVNPTNGMLLAAGMTTIAFLVSRPLATGVEARLDGAMPVGIALVLIGFLVVATRRQALAQVMGLVMVDNGIAVTALLASGGLPVIVELGALVDVALVVVVLLILTRRIRTAFSTSELHALSKLKD